MYFVSASCYASLKFIVPPKEPPKTDTSLIIRTSENTPRIVFTDCQYENLPIPPNGELAFRQESRCEDLVIITRGHVELNPKISSDAASKKFFEALADQFYLCDKK